VKLGLLYSESLSGSYYPLGEPSLERPARLSCNIRIADVAAFLRDRMAALDGTLTLEGLAEEAPVTGTVLYRWLEQYRLPYEISFRSDEGDAYVLRGQRNLHLLKVEESTTTLIASIYDTGGREVMRADLRFDARSDMGKMLRSFRFTYRTRPMP
jgi:hypothetical protein